LLHGLDIKASNLATELVRTLTIDRTQASFQNFAMEGKRGITPDVPAHSLLYHGSPHRT
jgi:hypothetical protein